jgi:LysM repeat protein
MTQMIFRRLFLLTLLLVMSNPFPAAAEEGQVYTIKKGDTLWGLSQRFIDDPDYWPDLWADNPAITNPHLIFPGQQILIQDGRLKIIPAYPEAGQAVQEEAAPEPKQAELPELEEVVQIKAVGGNEGFIRTGEIPLGLLVDSVDNRSLLTKNDLVFLKMTESDRVTVGDTYSLYKEGKEVLHPHSGETIGVMMNNLGILQVTEITNGTITAKVGEVYREVERGADLFEYHPPTREVTLKRGSAELTGVIVATRDGKWSMGANDLVFINLGSDDGLQPGNLCFISRPRQASAEIVKKAGDLVLPDVVLGAAVVIETHAGTASALIIKSVDAMYIGDQVTVVSN